MSKIPLKGWGLVVQTELLKRGETQEWLIQEIKKHTDNYVDGSNLYKILRGTLNSKPIINAINEILGISNT